MSPLRIITHKVHTLSPQTKPRASLVSHPNTLVRSPVPTQGRTRKRVSVPPIVFLSPPVVLSLVLPRLSHCFVSLSQPWPLLRFRFSLPLALYLVLLVFLFATSGFCFVFATCRPPFLSSLVLSLPFPATHDCMVRFASSLPAQSALDCILAFARSSLGARVSPFLLDLPMALPAA